MNVGQLKKFLADIPDKVRVVVPGPDHSYDEPCVKTSSALFHPEFGWTEDHGEKLTPEREWGKRQEVVILGE